MGMRGVRGGVVCACAGAACVHVRVGAVCVCIQSGKTLRRRVWERACVSVCVGVCVEALCVSVSVCVHV